MLFNLHVWIKVFAMAQRRAPASLPANNEFFLVMVPFILPMSAKSWKSTTDGIPIFGARFLFGA
jgi:hypothetical protein